MSQRGCKQNQTRPEEVCATAKKTTFLSYQLLEFSGAKDPGNWTLKTLTGSAQGTDTRTMTHGDFGSMKAKAFHISCLLWLCSASGPSGTWYMCLPKRVLWPAWWGFSSSTIVYCAFLSRFNGRAFLQTTFLREILFLGIVDLKSNLVGFVQVLTKEKFTQGGFTEKECKLTFIIPVKAGSGRITWG